MCLIHNSKLTMKICTYEMLLCTFSTVHTNLLQAKLHVYETETPANSNLISLCKFGTCPLLKKGIKQFNNNNKRLVKNIVLADQNPYIPCFSAFFSLAPTQHFVPPVLAGILHWSKVSFSTQRIQLGFALMG